MPSQQPETVTCVAYLTIVPKWKDWLKDDDGNPILEGAKVSQVTQSKPNSVKGGGIVTALTVEVSAETFLPIAPKATLQIDKGNAEIVLEATAEHPSDPDGVIAFHPKDPNP